MKIYRRVVTVIAIAMALFHLYAGGIQLFPATQQRAIHLGLGLALIFLIYPFFKDEQSEKSETQSKLSTVINIILAFVGLGSGIYIFVNYIEIASGLFNPSTMTVIVSLIIIILVLEASRRVLGNALPIIAMVFLAYVLIGDRLPILFAHSGYSLERIITQIGLSNEGIMGVPLGVSATYIVLFVVFGTLLEKSGAGKLFIDMAMAAVGRFRGGAAKVSVVSSALFGTISGSQVANVATTGVLTIPLMKKGGYKKEYAAAVEATASTGGMFLPPIMGAVSFLIADFLQVDYVHVLLAALIPAILYFVAVFVMVDLRAAKMNIKQDPEDFKVPDMKSSLKERGHLLLPLGVLIFLLIVMQVSPPLAGFWAIVSIPVFSALKKETRMGIGQIFDALEQGVKLSLVVVAATACAGVVIGAVNMTGLGLSFSGILIELAGSSLFMLLLLTMIASVVLGMGLPPVASYTILAVLAAPAIASMGVSPMAAHMFIFYYGTLSAITPPVAIASFAASGIAGANPLKTSLVAVRLAVVAFIIPFMFVYGPELIFEGSAISILIAAITATIGVYVLSVALEGYFVRDLNILSRVILVAAAIMLISVGYVTDVIALGVIVLILGREWMFKKRNDTHSSNSQFAIQAKSEEAQ